MSVLSPTSESVKSLRHTHTYLGETLILANFLSSTLISLYRACLIVIFVHLFDFFLVELDHRIDFELREGLVENRYWSAVTSHTAYWSSLDVALFLLTFMYKHEHDNNAKPNLDPI